MTTYQRSAEEDAELGLADMDAPEDVDGAAAAEEAAAAAAAAATASR
jgi:hypothetical protein